MKEPEHVIFGDQLVAEALAYAQVGKVHPVIVESIRTYERAKTDAEIERLKSENIRLRETLKGVIRIADRDCPEFRAARAALEEEEK